MSCNKCEIAQEIEKVEYYFRWKNANILLSGCEEHIKEVMVVLRDYIIAPKDKESP